MFEGVCYLKCMIVSSVNMTVPTHYATSSKVCPNCHVFLGVKRNKGNHKKILKQKFFS